MYNFHFQVNATKENTFVSILEFHHYVLLIVCLNK